MEPVFTFTQVTVFARRWSQRTMNLRLKRVTEELVDGLRPS